MAYDQITANLEHECASLRRQLIASDEALTCATAEILRLRAALENIAAYPKLRKDELGYTEARKIAWEALQGGSHERAPSPGDK